MLVHEGGKGLEGARERGFAVADAEVVRPRRDHIGEAVGRLDADARLGQLRAERLRGERPLETDGLTYNPNPNPNPTLSLSLSLTVTLTLTP